MSRGKAGNIINLANRKTVCSQCAARHLCLPIGVAAGELGLLESNIIHHRSLRRGQPIYRAGDPFGSIYAIRSGAAKTYVTTVDGEEHVTGFHLSGELVGLDGIHSEYHWCSAIALDTTSVCELPLDRLEELAGKIPSLQHHLLRIMSQKILHDEQMLLLLGKRGAERRLASLLLSIAGRYRERGYSRNHFRLVMFHTDIASYLGLTPETVSRLFHRFQAQGLIALDGKTVRLLDFAQMQALSGMGHDARGKVSS